MNKEKWTWMPHPGHFIGAQNCRFFLNTYVGKFLVSTVGEYLPDSQVREILAESRGIKLEGKGDERLADSIKKYGYEDIGYNRKYETMVFPATKSEHKCCPHEMNGDELDFDGYNTAEDAFKGHYKMCKKWATKKQP